MGPEEDNDKPNTVFAFKEITVKSNNCNTGRLSLIVNHLNVLASHWVCMRWDSRERYTGHLQGFRTFKKTWGRCCGTVH